MVPVEEEPGRWHSSYYLSPAKVRTLLGADHVVVSVPPARKVEALTGKLSCSVLDARVAAIAAWKAKWEAADTTTRVQAWTIEDCPTQYEELLEAMTASGDAEMAEVAALLNEYAGLSDRYGRRHRTDFPKVAQELADAAKPLRLSIPSPLAKWPAIQDWYNAHPNQGCTTAVLARAIVADALAHPAA